MTIPASIPESAGDASLRPAYPESATLEALPQDSLIQFMWAERRRFLPGLGFAVLRVLVISPLPIIFKHIVDTQMPAGDLTGILAISAFTVLLLVIHQWLLVRGAVRLGRAVSNLVLQIRSVIFRKIQYLSFAYLDRAKTGRLLSKYAFDTQKVDGVMMPLLNSFVPDSVYSIATFAILVSMNWQLSAVVVLMLPMIALLRAKFFGRLRRVHEVDRLAQERLTGTATEMLGALRLLRSYGQEEQARDTLHVDTRNAANSRVKMINAASTFGGFSFASMRVLTLFVIAGGAILAIHGAITTGEMLAFVAGVPVLVQPIQLFVQLSDQYFLGQEAYRSIRELLDEPQVELWKGRHVLDPIRGEIAFAHVSFRYPGLERDALHDFSLEIRPGEKIALVGPSGAGKSTVASLLLGLYAPAEGRIRFDGVPQQDLDMRGLRRRIAIVLQETMLLSGSVEDNLRFARPEATDEEIRESARLANAEEFILRLPDGFQTVIGERGTTLSGGQRQRLAIARALLRNPAILILDEPTSSLDYESERLIQHAMVRLTEGRTVITIAHRLSTIRDVDRVVVLREGCKVEEGTFEELSERGEYFSALLKARDIM